MAVPIGEPRRKFKMVPAPEVPSIPNTPAPQEVPQENPVPVN